MIASGPDWMDFQAGDYAAGTDTFTYAVVDALGARATGTVRVGIAAARRRRAQPGRRRGRRDRAARARRSSMQVLANDSDPDGSPLSVTQVTSLDGKAKAKIERRHRHRHGAEEPRRLRLPLHDPERARRHQRELPPGDGRARTPRSPGPSSTTPCSGCPTSWARTSVDVNVLANVFFADGPVSTLEAVGRARLRQQRAGDRRASASGSRSAPRARSSRSRSPTPTTRRSSPTRFVRVPGYDDALPQLKRGAPKLTVVSEKTLTIHLNDYIVAVGDRKVRLTDAATVRATHANGDDLVVEQRHPAVHAAARGTSGRPPSRSR